MSGTDGSVMKLFNDSKEAAPMTKSGSDVLRAATRARNKGAAFALLARDLDIGIAALDAFARGEGTLPDAIMSALAKHIFGDNVTFDAARNLLVRAKRVPIPAGLLPPRYVPPPRPVSAPSPPPIRSDKPPPVQPKGRPGWAD
jgi:hypothetical protein